MLDKLRYRAMLTTVLALALIVPWTTAAAVDYEPPQPPFTLDTVFIDDTGMEVPFGLDAQRIVTLAPNVTEIVCFLGYGDRLVGCSDFCDYPPEVVAGLPRVGGFIDTSLEAIVALDPDLVIAYQGNSRELVDQLRELDINVLAFREAPNLAILGMQMAVINKVIQTEDAAPGHLIGDFLRKVHSVPAAPLFDSHPRVFFGYPGEMSYTCGPDSFLDDLIRRAGCRNVITDGTDRWPMVGAEFIIAADPDVILTATSCTADQDAQAVRAEMLATLRADPVWSGLKAVQLGRVVVIDSDVLMRPGPRLLDAVEDFTAQIELLLFTPTQSEGGSQ